MKTLLLAALAWCAFVSATAQTAREEIAANRYLCGSNYVDYDRHPATKPLTPAPRGYEPYYMSHYGRHGSRWLIGDVEYTRVIEPLRRAEKAGALTETGLKTLRQLEEFYPCTIKRLGDLTTVGERQHHGIGRRMTEHFPEIFGTKNVPIDARSTVVTRCILSMTAECEEFAAFNPTARIHNDVSESLQYYLNQPWTGEVKRHGGRGWGVVNEYRKKLAEPERINTVLFTNQQWVKDSLDAKNFMRYLFEVAGNMQSHDNAPDLLQLFTDDECYKLWCARNIEWYQDYGPSPYTGSVMPFSQANLLKNIIATADTVTMTQATLRFGHEVCVMPLACLLELDSCGAVVSDMDHLDDVWRNYNIYPMGCNVQLVFYRPKKGKTGDILVKALLNEREASLPVKTDNFPYYKWEDLRAYYLKKLERVAND